MTPLYDVLTAQPSLEARQIEKKQMKLAHMSVGDRRHYVLDRIAGRHFRQNAKNAGVPDALVEEAIRDIRDHAEPALHAVETLLPAGFPESIHAAVSHSVRERLTLLS